MNLSNWISAFRDRSFGLLNVPASLLVLLKEPYSTVQVAVAGVLVSLSVILNFLLRRQKLSQQAAKEVLDNSLAMMHAKLVGQHLTNQTTAQQTVSARLASKDVLDSVLAIKQAEWNYLLAKSENENRREKYSIEVALAQVGKDVALEALAKNTPCTVGMNPESKDLSISIYPTLTQEKKPVVRDTNKADGPTIIRGGKREGGTS